MIIYGDGKTTYTLDGTDYQFNDGDFSVKATADGQTSIYQGNITFDNTSTTLAISDGKTIKYGYQPYAPYPDGVVVNVSGGNVTKDAP